MPEKKNNNRKEVKKRAITYNRNILVKNMNTNSLT